MHQKEAAAAGSICIALALAISCVSEVDEGAVAERAADAAPARPSARGEVDWDRVIVAGRYPRYCAEVAGVLFFGVHQERRAELWKSAHNPVGAAKVAELKRLSYLKNVAGTLFLTADDGEHGRELWTSDGTAAGTVMLKDIRPGAQGSEPYPLVDVGGVLYFTADDGAHGRELWRSDGTPAGTTMLRDIRPGKPNSYPKALIGVGGLLLFSANDGTHGEELWRSDGTEAGTVMVKDVNPGAGHSRYSRRTGYTCHHQARLGARLFFVADDGTHGQELWRSDGAEAGTVMVKDIQPRRALGSAPRFLTSVGGTLLFRATGPHAGHQVWRSDGTEAGTKILRVIDARFGFSYPERLWEVGGRLLLIVYNDPNRRHELWTSDGTREGTVMVREIHSRTWTDFSCRTVRAGGALYFLVSDKKKGNELWKSDCSPEGTQMVIGEARPVLDAVVQSRRVTGLARVGETVFADVDWLVSDPGSRTGLSRVKGLARTDGTRDGTYLMWQRRGEAPRPERRIEIPHPIGLPPSGRQ